MSTRAKLLLAIPVLYAVAANIVFILLFDTDSVRWYQVAGVALTDVAFALWITARVQLGDSFSLLPEARRLVKTGLYARFRHPVYYASLLALVGMTLFLAQLYLIPLLLALAGFEGVRITKEELVLRQAYGDEYRDYRRKTWF